MHRGVVQNPRPSRRRARGVAVGGLPTAGRSLREDADVETSSEGYARRFAGPVGRWFLELQAESALALLADLAPGARVLDVGGGHAQLAPMLLEAGYDVTVAGSNSGCAARLQPLLSERCRFVAADLLELPHQDRSFDAVLSFRLLPHSVDWCRLTAELCRVARRAVVVDYPSRRSVNVAADRLFGLKRRLEGNTRPFMIFTPAQIAEEFARHGFRVAGTRPQCFWPMVLHRAHGSAAIGRFLEAPVRLAGLTRLLGSPIVMRADRG